MLENFYQKYKNELIFLLLIFLFLNVLIYVEIFKLIFEQNAKVYFLNVGQGDSQLIVLPRNVKILIDGGPLNKNLLLNLDKILPFYDRYIDLVINTHPETDHFGGLIELFKRYKIGYFLDNGFEGKTIYFLFLKNIIKEKNIKTLSLDSNDKIIYLNAIIDIIWPKNKAEFRDLNNNSLVFLFSFKEIKVLFTGDISSKVEKKIKNDLDKIDILKVAHHGSKNSNSFDFLKIIQPKIAVIGVGKNKYGHPHFQVLKNLNLLNSKIYRTDLNGNILIYLKDDKKIKIITEN